MTCGKPARFGADTWISPASVCYRFDWYAQAQGTILRPDRLGSVISIKHIQGRVFHTKEEAGEHGFKRWKATEGLEDWDDNET